MSEPIVTVEQGKLRGSVVKSVLGTSYIAFKGIPFAAPPIGDLRFKVIIILRNCLSGLSNSYVVMRMREFENSFDVC